MTKIYILGPVGSGKTTLANKLSEELKIKHHELDSIVWKYNSNGDIKRNDEEIKKLFSKLIKTKNWIIEDVGRSIFDDGLKEADAIIYLNILRPILYFRILSRWVKQKLKIEKATYKADIKMLKLMYKWANTELKNSKLDQLGTYKDKLLILNYKSSKNYAYNSK